MPLPYLAIPDDLYPLVISTPMYLRCLRKKVPGDHLPLVPAPVYPGWTALPRATPIEYGDRIVYFNQEEVAEALPPGVGGVQRRAFVEDHLGETLLGEEAFKHGYQHPYYSLYRKVSDKDHRFKVSHPDARLWEGDILVDAEVYGSVDETPPDQRILFGDAVVIVASPTDTYLENVQEALHIEAERQGVEDLNSLSYVAWRMALVPPEAGDMGAYRRARLPGCPAFSDPLPLP